MRRSGLLFGLAAVLAVSFLPASSAQAQLLRTYVSGKGDDANPCSPEAPCKSFAGALLKTAAGSEINCLDTASYGAMNIGKAITIDCTGTSAGTATIIVQAGSADKVTLRGLSLNGAATSFNANGIRYLSGGHVHVENVIIENYTNAGISVEKTDFGVLTVKNVSFNKSPSGIKIQATSGSISASVADSSFNNLTNTGIEVGARAYATVSRSTFTAIYGYGIKATTSTSYASATNNVFSSSYIGMSANVSGAKINATGNQFFGNSKAFNVAAGGIFISGNGNAIDVNPGNPPTGALTYR